MRSLNAFLEIRGNDRIPRLNIGVFVVGGNDRRGEIYFFVSAKGHIPNGFSFLCTRDFHRVSVLGNRRPLFAGSDLGTKNIDSLRNRAIRTEASSEQKNDAERQAFISFFLHV